VSHASAVAGATTLDDETFDDAILDVEPLTIGRFGPRRFTTNRPVRGRSELGRDLVPRTALLNRLELERGRRLVLLTAPAGYGKTSLLVQWSQASTRPFVWVGLTQGVGDGETLIDAIGTALAERRIAPHPAQSFVLVIDDAHVLPPDALHDAVLDVLDWLPDGSQLALASRSEPALGLSRLRAQRVLLEVRSAELAMSTAEAESLLRTAGIDVQFTSVRALVERTEGWPAALELAALSCARRPDQAEGLMQVSGDDFFLSDYFRTEIVAKLSPSATRFLIRSSVLERLSGPLCDAVLERKRSALTLADLALTNVPLKPMDASHEWYRVHPLFREMLRTELRRSEPGRVRELHLRAADWLWAAGDLDGAIDHSRSAEDLDRTGELLWANLSRYIGHGRNDRIQRWLGGVSAEGPAPRAPLALAAAHSHLAAGNVAIAEQWARSAAVSMSSASEASTKDERASVLIIGAWAARAGAKAMQKDAVCGYDLLRDDSPWRASCCFLRGTAALLTGDDATAEHCLEEGAARGAVLAPDAAALCLAQLAVVAAERDQGEVASDFARRAREVVDQHGLGMYPTSALVFAVAAAAGVRDGRVDEAKPAVASCLGLVDRLDDSVSWYGAEVRILLARASIALGDVAAAREQLADASRLARRMSDVVVFQRWFDDVWNRFDQRAETALTGVGTLTTAELRVLRFLPTHYSFREIAQRLHVTSNTVKTHVHAVYRKLDASSRSEAVSRATDAGLLG
jgi:LuxR family transcriptional regulator, maltose regulon positive regulatory protein